MPRRKIARARDARGSDQVSDTGLEHPANPAGNSRISDSGGSKSGNIGDSLGPPTPPATPTDPDLAGVVAAWPTLPPALRSAVLAIVAAHHDKGGGRER
jgi:hypothetical protein